MLLFPLLTAILLSARAVLLATAATPPSELSWRHRLQARRENIVKQLQEGSHRLRARASPAPCETTVDTNGNCCTTTALQIDFKCCPADQVYTPECGDPSCCDDGVLFGPAEDGGCCRLPGVLYTPRNVAEGLFDCCPSGLVIAGGGCCAIGQRIENGLCVSNPVISKRAEEDLASGSFMVKRGEGLKMRSLLSADLVAEHLANNGVFTYAGIKHVDRGFQGHNEGVLRRLSGRGIHAALKLVRRYSREYDEDMWNALGDHVPISEHYEFAIKDVPEIFARIVAKDDFESFLWRGATFDRNSLYGLVRGHPGFNESLIAQYR